MEYYKIQHNVLMQPKRRNGRWITLCRDMSVGDSVALKSLKEAASLRVAFGAQRRRLQVRKQLEINGRPYWRCWAA